MLSTMFLMDLPNTSTKTSLLHPRVFVFYCSKLPVRFSCPLMPANDGWDIWWYTFTSSWLTKHQDNQVEHCTTKTKETRGLNWTRLRSTMAGEAAARCGSCRWQLPAWLTNVLWSMIIMLALMQCILNLIVHNLQLPSLTVCNKLRLWDMGTSLRAAH